MRTMFALAAALLLAANAEAAGSPAPVALGETAELANGVRVTPLVVEEDSRCPKGVTCIWAGRLVLRATVERGEQSQEKLLELYAPTRITGGMLTLNLAEPAPKADSPALPGPDYRFTFSYTPDVAR